MGAVCQLCWSKVTGRGLVCTGWRHTESGMEMILIKGIFGCLNLIRLPVPLADVIVLIGSFVSFTHSVDVTMEMFSSCLISFAIFPPCLCGVLPLCLPFITLRLCVCVCLSSSLLDWLNKSRNDSLLRRYKSCSSLQPPRKHMHCCQLEKASFSRGAFESKKSSVSHQCDKFAPQASESKKGGTFCLLNDASCMHALRCCC